MSDLVERLRDTYENWGLGSKGPFILKDAADRISSLAAENATLRAINANLMGDDEDKPRYTTKRLRQEITKATSTLEAELQKAREALEPFAKEFERHRDFYAQRYQDREIGYANFDKMPDEWAMEKVTFNMGAYRRARAALKDKGAVDKKDIGER